MIMSSKPTDRSVQLDRLRADYRGAFEEWASEVSRMHDIRATAAPASLTIQEAEERVDVAQSVYRRTRNRLMEEMDGEPARPPAAATLE
jgi:hypothetical protein